MGCLGVLFSLDEETIAKMRSFSSDEERLDYLKTDIEDVYFEEHEQWKYELGKSWEAMHRSLTNGKMECKDETYPLNHVILGGEKLYRKSNYTITLKTPKQVADVFKYFDSVTKDSLREKYFKISKKEYIQLSEEDFEYVWEYFSESRAFWKLAHEENRHVIFTVDH
jgi:Domain of unknown function (DUF1877)